MGYTTYHECNGHEWAEYHSGRYELPKGRTIDITPKEPPRPEDWAITVSRNGEPIEFAEIEQYLTHPVEFTYRYYANKSVVLFKNALFDDIREEINNMLRSGFTVGQNGCSNFELD